MDDCTKESVCLRQTDSISECIENFAGAKKDDAAWASRYVGVTLQNRKQQKETERPRDFYRREFFGLGRVFLYLTGTLYG